MIQFFRDLINKENPTCAKTFIGIVGGISLILRMIWNPSQILVESVLILTIGALAITGAETIFKK
jgi:hypothetical protein